MIILEIALEISLKIIEIFQGLPVETLIISDNGLKPSRQQ